MPYLQKILKNYILLSFFLKILLSHNIYVKRVAAIIKAGHESSFEDKKKNNFVPVTPVMLLQGLAVNRKMNIIPIFFHVAIL